MIKKTIFISLFTLFSLNFYAQDKVLPKGWDRVILEGKTAYMNLITGDIFTTFPKKPALNKKEVVEYDPTQLHIVKKGETLSKIARQYNKTLAELYKLNSLENFDAIKIGQQIVVGYNKDFKETPNAKYEDSIGKSHKVKSGETLYSIALKYNLSVAKLKSLNSLNSNAISVGQELIIK